MTKTPDIKGGAPGPGEPGRIVTATALGAAAIDLARTHAEKIRYLFVGVMNTAIGYGLFALMLWALTEPLKSLSGSASPSLAYVGDYYYLIISWTNWVLCVPISTLTMKYLAFRSPGHPARQILKAYFVYLPMQGIGSLLLWLSVHFVGLPPLLGQFLTIFVTTIFSYLGHKYFTFSAPGPKQESSDE